MSSTASVAFSAVWSGMGMEAQVLPPQPHPLPLLVHPHHRLAVQVGPPLRPLPVRLRPVALPLLPLCVPPMPRTLQIAWRARSSVEPFSGSLDLKLT